MSTVLTPRSFINSYVVSSYSVNGVGSSSVLIKKPNQQHLAVPRVAGFLVTIRDVQHASYDRTVELLYVYSIPVHRDLEEARPPSSNPRLLEDLESLFLMDSFSRLCSHPEPERIILEIFTIEIYGLATWQSTG